MSSCRLGILALALVGCGGVDPIETTPGDASNRDASDRDAGAGDAQGTDAAAPGADTAGTDGARESGATATLLSKSAGGRSYRLYVPSTRAPGSPAPLVLMLHGCNQTPDDFAAGTRMNDVAEARGWLVAYPEQPSSAQPYQCWQWYEASQQRRDGSEPASLAAIVDAVRKEQGIDPKRVYVAGLSAGGAMAVVLGATYPDLFAAIAVHSGVEFGGATSAAASVNVLRVGGPSPDAQGDAAWAAMGARARVVAALVIHGEADKVVAPVNGAQVVSQWLRTNDRADDGALNGSVPTTPTSSATGAADGKGWKLSAYADKTGRVVVQSYSVAGLPHAWSGGDPAGTWTDTGPSASAWVADFFAAH
jgi:poly(hydroxyalkanoate) depolymerase family esterase